VKQLEINQSLLSVYLSDVTRNYSAQAVQLKGWLRGIEEQQKSLTLTVEKLDRFYKTTVQKKNPTIPSHMFFLETRIECKY